MTVIIREREAQTPRLPLCDSDAGMVPVHTRVSCDDGYIRLGIPIAPTDMIVSEEEREELLIAKDIL
jgi:hypothetical protein